MSQREFENIVEKLRPKLLLTARHFLSATDIAADAEDIVQETVITLWRLCRSGYDIRNHEALAVKIAKNICVAHYRKQKFRTEEIHNDNYIGSETADAAVEEADNLRIRNELLKNLTDTQKELVRMRNEDGLSLDRISEITGKPKTSVKSTISAARKRMMETLGRLI